MEVQREESEWDDVQMQWLLRSSELLDRILNSPQQPLFSAVLSVSSRQEDSPPLSVWLSALLKDAKVLLARVYDVDLNC